MKNKVTLIGYVGKDPEVKQAGSSTVAKFTLATSEKFKDKDGNKQEKTQWHNLECWGKLAETVGKFVKKGSKIDVEGKIEYDEYTNKEGIKVKTTKINVRDIVFLDGKPAGTNGTTISEGAPANTTATNGASKKNATAPAKQTPAPVTAGTEDDSDLPF